MELKYNVHKKIIYAKTSDTGNVILEENLPSQPILSPNNERAVYIAPYGWELIGKVYLLNLNNLKKEVIYEPKDNNITPKDLTWIDNRRIAMILGYPYGTISVGGNIYIYDINTKTMKLFHEFSDFIQITNIEYLNNQLLLKGKKYIDNNYLESKVYQTKLKIKD